MKTFKSLWLIVLVLVCSFACKTIGGPDIEARPGGSSAPAPVPGEAPENKPMRIELSDGTAIDKPTEAPPTSAGSPLSDARIVELLKLFVEPLEMELNKPGFLKRPGSKPAPRSATPKEIAFPPDTDGPAAPQVDVRPLQVLSVTPDGELSRAPRVSISFNNPMIEVSDPKANEEGEPFGITIDPRPAGKWRWLGTQTLIFEPEGSEFPRATEYTVMIPAGLTDVNGSRLDTPVVGRFVLPAPSVERLYPSGSGHDLDPLLYVVFDQPVDPSSALKAITLKNGSSKVALRQLTSKEAEAFRPGVSRGFEKYLADRVFYFRVSKKLTPATTYELTVDKGVESREGPVLSKEPKSVSFSTYEPLELTARHPETDKNISPFDSFVLYFNNQLDKDLFREDMIRVSPELKNAKVSLYGQSIHISGPKNGKTTYKVTVSRNLTDEFGQKLGKDLVLDMKTGRAPSALIHGLDTFTLLDPSVTPGLTVYTTNVETLEVMVYRVSPSDWSSYLYFGYDYQSAYKPEAYARLTPPGKKISEETITVGGQPDELTTTRIDLSKYLKKSEGDLVVWVRDPRKEEHRYVREFFTWVQSTDLGLDVEFGPNNAVAMVTELATGKPVSGAKVTVGGETVTTDKSGLATLNLSSSDPVIVARARGSKAFIPASTSFWNRDAEWKSRYLPVDRSWFLFDDRGIYRPGETVRVKGYLRTSERGPQGKLVAGGKAGQKVSWTLVDPRGNKIDEGETELNAFSGLDLEFELPTETNLGKHRLNLSGNMIEPGHHVIEVQEFRRPEFEVKTEVLSDEPHLLGESATIEAVVAYFAGGGLANSDVRWNIKSRESTYAPPGRSDFSFGRWSPWWDLGPWWLPRPSKDTDSDFTLDGVSDSEGVHRVNLEFVEVYPPTPTSVSATATVTDVNRQQQAATSTLLVHPSQRYVGLRMDKTFVGERDDFVFEFIVTDIDGAILPGVPVDLQLVETTYSYVRGSGYEQKERLVDSRRVNSSETPQKATLRAKEGGTFQVKAFVRDQKERLNFSETRVWKAGGTLPSADRVELESLTVIPDKKDYQPGDTAKLLVMAPFTDGEGLVVWDHDGLVDKKRFTLKNGTATLEYPIDVDMIPNLWANITVVGSAPWGEGRRPAVASSTQTLSVSTDSHRLQVELLPTSDKLEPGATVEVPVEIKDHTGKPVSDAEVTLWVVDEAVLGLTGYKTPDPLTAFYKNRARQFSPYHNRTFVSLSALDEDVAEPQDPRMDHPTVMYSTAAGVTRGDVMEGALAPQAKRAASPQGSETPFTVRTNFDALAIFKAELKTDNAGRTSVSVKLPDNLTRYRIMSVAVKDGDKFGNGDHLLTARLPVMVRPSLPRFLNFGDRAYLPVVVQNQTDRELSVDVIAEANGVHLVGATGKSVKVPANDRVEVLFEAEANQVGKAHFRFGAVSGRFSDAATLSLPVYTPASGEAFATYGQLGDDGAIQQPVKRPDDVWSEFGGLKVTMSSTALSELTDAFVALWSTDYKFPEHIASRILGVVTMREVLSEFNPADAPSDSELERVMSEDLLDLSRLQNGDGGFSFWERDDKSVPFVTVHVMHALVRANLEGYTVDQSVLDRGLAYLRDIERKCAAREYSEQYTRSITAFALYVRHLASDSDVDKAKTLLPHFMTSERPNLDAIGWLWPLLSDGAKGSAELADLRQFVRNRAVETAEKAQFTKSFGEGEGEYLLLYSERRTDAILLNALLHDQPDDPLNAKIVKGLLGHRVKGSWRTTQENMWVLIALQSYFKAYESQVPNFLGSLWLDETFFGEEQFEGRSGKEAFIEVPMSELPKDRTGLIVAKKGDGRLYYRVGLEYAPKSLRLPSENRGFLVQRTYRGLDADDDVKRLDNGDWKVKAGAKVEVTLTMVAPERRTHVSLVDQLPAGLEPLNPVLKGTPPVSQGSKVEQSDRWYYRFWRWYQHDNLRDERVEAFASLLYPGVYTYTYTAVATTPGEYVLPPVKAMEMYSPEVFGRTESGRFIVE